MTRLGYLLTGIAGALALVAIAGAADADPQHRSYNLTGHSVGGEYYFEADGLDGRNPSLRVDPGDTVTLVFRAAEGRHGLYVASPINDWAGWVSTDPANQVPTNSTFTFKVPDDLDRDFNFRYFCQAHWRDGMEGTFNMTLPKEPEAPKVTLSAGARLEDTYFFQFDDYEGRNPDVVIQPGTNVTVKFVSLSGSHDFNLGTPFNLSTEVVSFTGDRHTELTFFVPEGFSGVVKYWCNPHRGLGMEGRLYTKGAEGALLAADNATDEAQKNVAGNATKDSGDKDKSDAQNKKPSVPEGAAFFDVTGYAEDGRFYFLVDGLPGENPALPVKAGQDVTVRYKSISNVHNFHVGLPIDQQTPVTGPDEDASLLTFTVPADIDRDIVEYWCDPHKGLKMKGVLEVAGAKVPTTPPTKKTPGPAAAFIVVALAAVALGLARRR